MNWSLTSDRIAPQGDVFAMLPARNLIMYSSGKPTQARALQSTDASERGEDLSTDSFPRFNTMDIDSFEDFRDSVTEGLQERKRLFVEDAAVGGYRTSEIKVRVVSDRPEAALFFRNMLIRVPRYTAEAFPRNIVVIDASMHGTGFDGRGTPAEHAAIASDIDPDAPTSAKASIVVRGRVPLAQIMEHVAHCATQLAVIGGYRHLDGVPPAAVVAEREDGAVLDRRYWTAQASDPHPSLLVLRGDLVRDAKSGETTAVLGAGGAVAASVAAASLTGALETAEAHALALAAARLGAPAIAAHHFVWDDSRVSPLWGGVAAPAASLGGVAALPRGAISLNGGATAASGLAAPATADAPTKVVLVSKAAQASKSVDRAAFVAAAAKEFSMSDDEVTILDARLAAAQPKLTIVSAVEQAMGKGTKA